MSEVAEVLPRLRADLERRGRRFALVGALAVGARCRARFTKDVDIAVIVDSDADAEALVRDLQAAGYGVVAVVEHGPSGRLATVRLELPESRSAEPDADLLFASSGIESEIVACAERITVFGTETPVARLGHLLALKTLSHDADRRPQDRLDIIAMLATANDADLALAREAVALIESRGFNRGRNLSAEIEAFIASARADDAKN